MLFSIREEDIPVFRLLRMRARRAPGLIEDAKEVLLSLFDTDVEYSADTLEGIYDDLKKVSAQVLEGDVTDDHAQKVLADIAWQEDLNGRIRRNMLDTRRAVSFMMRSKMLNAEQFEDARQILRDIESLDSHTQFLFDKINFLMDATGRFFEHQPEQDHQDLLGGQRRPAAAHADRQRLRHELPARCPSWGGNGAGVIYALCSDDRQRRGAHAVFSQARLVEVAFGVKR